MAEKKPNKSNADQKVVRRVKATTDKPARVISKQDEKLAAKKSEKSETKKTTKKTSSKKSHVPRWIRAIGGYFSGSWRELRQVRWPNRKATWSMTAAVLLFTAFFALLILLADWIFNWLIKEVIL